MTNVNKKKLTDIHQHLNTGSMTQAILQKGKHLQMLADQLQGFLPDHLASQCQLANMNGQTLTYLTNNAHIAMQLRALEAPLLQAATELSSRKLSTLVVKIDPTVLPDFKKTIQHSIPQTAAQRLLNTAEHLDDNPALQNALRKLAKHSR